MRLFLVSLQIAACTLAAPKAVDNSTPVAERSYTMPQEYKAAYFASGCFWCVEAVFEHVDGVQEAISGYAGGTTINPNYRQVVTGKTGHAESIKVIYDPKKVSFETLVQVFFGSHNPTTLNRQGPDKGTHYRSIAFYETEDEKKAIEKTIKKLTEIKRYKSPIVTEVKKLDAFYQAEDYHQDYEEKNPNNPYIRAVSKPRVSRFLQAYPELVKVDLE
ncbi:MAG: peptide-methionine (S)-S-oxide reductase MsrA [Bacteroidetes bacterium]|nr:peptide-methionine (S)-S-oxide reductase MsrA [Bacteroidota bacterium]MDA0888964.1 peptide-methionine (S)-S-oxide reductase MsrA [Bacteroidota bacterium]MDA1084757.1 peptide-methionine (S)-S-oxide reductase MsrA [Bacteroidota bacterium]